MHYFEKYQVLSGKYWSHDTLVLKFTPKAGKMSNKQTSLESFFVKGTRPSEEIEDEPMA